LELTLEDKIAIHELIARYNWAADTGDAKAWAATFTPDGVFDGWLGRFEGRDEIAGSMTSHAQASPDEHDEWSKYRGKVQHWVGNVVLEGDGDRATGACYFVLFYSTRGGGEVVGGGKYQDVLVKNDGQWLFERRHVVPDSPSQDAAGG
jgi:uncharacterized protein (TIGR02246 family)